MRFDVAAEVTANTRLSPDYNVIALAAPDIARAARPGQFVMIRPHAGFDPLLRRPFSIFECALDASGEPVGITILNKKVGVGTSLLFAVKPGDRVSVLGPLGRPFAPVDPPAEAWMVAGGVGLAPFATLAEALRARGVKTTLFYGAARPCACSTARDRPPTCTTPTSSPNRVRRFTCRPKTARAVSAASLPRRSRANWRPSVRMPPLRSMRAAPPR
jgi:NAD(P)H-flavin reductase